MHEMPAEEVTFDEVRHEYRHNKIIVPSVTQVLSILNDFTMIDPAVLEYKRNLGTQVHAATALDDADNLGDYDPVIDGYIEAWRLFKRQAGFIPLHIEQRVFHEAHMYAGTLDRVGKIGDSLVLVDIKTGTPNKLTIGPQLAAYAEANGMSKQPRYSVQLLPDGKYKLTKCENKMDFQIFLNCLNIWRWRQQK